MDDFRGKAPVVIRPDYDVPDQVVIIVDETTGMWLEDAVRKQIATLKMDIDAHDYCKPNEGCLVRQRQTPDAPLAQVCDEDLMFLHAELGKLYSFVNSIAYLRNNPRAYSFDMYKPVDLSQHFEDPELVDHLNNYGQGQDNYTGSKEQIDHVNEVSRRPFDEEAPKSGGPVEQYNNPSTGDDE